MEISDRKLQNWRLCFLILSSQSSFNLLPYFERHPIIPEWSHCNRIIVKGIKKTLIDAESLRRVKDAVGSIKQRKTALNLMKLESWRSSSKPGNQEGSLFEQPCFPGGSL